MTTVLPVTASPGRPSSPQAVLRGDIEGLRAIAVLMVLAYHLGLPGSSGGFAGVDVFFVISGYLITNQLVREATRDGRVSLPRFYARRARRLLPAATLVLVCTSVAGWLLLPRGRHAELGTEVLAATGYVVNWLFAYREVDYLAEDADPSLVQHYWSLSVEEQFYVVWPLLIIATLWVARRLRLRFRPVLTVVLAGLVIGSAAWSVVHTAASPGTAYFATTTRAWQLGVGALLVLLTPLLARLRRPAASAAAWTGLVLIGVTFLAVSTRTPWPGSAAALPTLGTAAVIAAGIAWPSSPPARLLGVPPMRFLGALSYGLYLWHWPALRLLEETHPDARLPTRLAVGLLSVLLAWLTLRLVENPIRFGRAVGSSPRPALAMGAAAMSVSAALGLSLLLTAPRLEAPAADAVGAIALVDPASRTTTELRAVDDPSRAVAHVDTLTPDPAVVEKDISVAYRDGCQVSLQGTERRPDDACWYGDLDGDVVVALVGDSKMEQWSSALHAIGRVEGWRIKVYTKSGCGFVDEGRTEECHAYNSELSAHLGDGEHTPDLVLTSVGSGYTGLEGSMAELLAPALDGGARLVVLADTAVQEPRGEAEGVTAYECLDAHRDDWTSCWSDQHRANGAAVLEALARRLPATLVDLTPWICPSPADLGGCSPVVGGVVVNRQGSHLSGSYVRSLTPILHHELARTGVATTALDQIAWDVPTDPPR
ncbi:MULTISPECIES: acyltransferase family protein [unclassified Ornithinimicrobium]|uniref:acyltransferase family protein n=1 Tax=unclassified Ornithinimicrobium TaxID=2615080 RepID=UPI003852049E